MRELRFRSWNGDMMSNPFEMSQMLPDKCGGFVDSDGVSIYWDSIENDGGYVMKYTGITGMLGKEIYEHDIINYGRGYGKGKEFEDIYVVKFGEYDNGECYEDKVDGNGWFMQRLHLPSQHVIGMGDMGKRLQVIGNVYENPELLEQT